MREWTDAKPLHAAVEEARFQTQKRAHIDALSA